MLLHSADELSTGTIWRRPDTVTVTTGPSLSFKIEHDKCVMTHGYKQALPMEYISIIHLYVSEHLLRRVLQITEFL